jgi:hypothetical protein
MDNVYRYDKKKDVRGKNSLDEFALTFLTKNPNVDCVLNGMLREEYVDKALKLLK